MAYDHDNGHGHSRHHKDSAEIERELDRTRERIDEHARLLQERLSPGQLLDQTLERVRGSGSGEFFSNFGRTVRDNPVPVILTGLGLTWLAASTPHDDRFDDDEDEDSRSIGERVGAAKERAQRAGESARGALGRAGDAARGAAGRAGGAARSAARRTRSAKHRLASRGADLRHGAARGGEQLRRGWDRLLDEQPILLGLFGAAIGAAIGFTVPPSEREDEWMGEASDDLKTRAARKGREGVEHARERAESALSGERSDGESASAARSSTSSAGGSSTGAGPAGASGAGTFGATGGPRGPLPPTSGPGGSRP